MLKLIGSFMIGGACVYLGFKRSMNMKKRLSSLKSIQNKLSLLESEIGFRGLDLKEAFINIDNSNGIFSDAANYIEEEGIKKAWNNSVKKHCSKCCFTEGDVDTLLMLGQRLGMTDTENQIKHINGIKNILDIHIKAAQYDVEHFGRLYSGGGVLTGIFLILILL